MAVVTGIREKVHWPVYDALNVDPEEQLYEVEKTGVLKFFVDVQKKTKLHTNLQSASLLPHYNTFEARAMRVVISDLPAKFSSDFKVQINDKNGAPKGDPIPLDEFIDLMKEAEDSENGEVKRDDTSYTLEEINNAFDELGQKAPPDEQIWTDNGSGNLISKIIYNTVTTFYVGEKVMIQMPTYFFPSGAGAFSSDTGKYMTHGEPNPTATFRFAEPVFIDKQQNFRVEIEVPDSKVLKEIQKIYGPFTIWLILDGYMTRDVQ